MSSLRKVCLFVIDVHSVSCKRLFVCVPVKELAVIVVKFYCVLDGWHYLTGPWPTVMAHGEQRYRAGEISML
jgi:hypothetical protein